MGITVGAALKKAAIAILGNPKALKKLLFAVLVVFVALLLPMVMVVCLFSGSFQVDSGELLRYVEANLTESDVQLLQSVETTMTEIENAMIEAELSADVGAAQALYIMALYDFASQPGFVSRLVSCFEAEQTDAQLIANVNAAFGTEIPVQEFTDVMRNVAPGELILPGMWTAAPRTIWIWCSGRSLPVTPDGAMSWVLSGRC